MFEEFCPTLGTKVRFDSQGVPRDVIHQEHFRSSAPNPEGAVRDYLGKHHGLIKIRNKELRNLHRAPSPAATSAKIEYRLHYEKLQFNTTTVAYHQTIFGLPIGGWVLPCTSRIRLQNGMGFASSARKSRGD